MQSQIRRRSVMDQETRIRLVESEKQLQFDFSDIYARACSDRDIRGMKMVLKGLAELGIADELVNQMLNTLASSSDAVSCALEELKPKKD